MTTMETSRPPGTTPSTRLETVMSAIAWLVIVSLGLFLLDHALPADIGIAVLTGLLVVLAIWRRPSNLPVGTITVALVVLALLDMSGQAGLTPLLRIRL